MILAIDAGNTRTKWGLFGASGEMVAQGALDNSQLGQLVQDSVAWVGCRRAVVSNVAGRSVELQLQALLNARQIRALWVKSEAAACGVINNYVCHEQLGTDRWAALIAAWSLYRQPCVVAMAGTALTVDALSAQGEFLGGLILPGRGLMRESLAAGTAALSVGQGVLCDFPSRTEDAIASGIAFSMAGAVERQCAALEQREGAVRCLLSGGDAQRLAAALPRSAEIVDNLALRGLFLIERERS
jgi:type III pantothenate kinase